MEYRKKMDDKVLNNLKDKVQNYLIRKGITTADFIRQNMDEVENLYVENSLEQGKSKMASRGARNGRSSEIMIDKSFAKLDENDNPIGIDENVKKLIRTQLTHELLHSGARYDGYTGINIADKNRGLNEGMTQMITEKIWGYTVSPNADNAYKDYKKIAKILDATFGENVSLDTYFNHTNGLEVECNKLSQNNKFYSNLNRYMTSTYYMNKKVSKDNKDSYFPTLMKPIKEKMINLLYEKVCAEIIVPKLKTLTKDEQRRILV